jgi:site-specific recombinase
MKRVTVWAGFKDVWQVVIFDSFKKGGEPWINRFDFGVMLGVMSILGALLGIILSIRAVFLCL